MWQVTINELIRSDALAHDVIPHIASELDRRGASVRELLADEVRFRGTLFAPTWQPFSGIGEGSVTRTSEGLIVRLSFPFLIPFGVGAAFFIIFMMAAGAIPWELATMAFTFFPLVVYLGTRASVERVLRIIRNASHA